MDEPGQAAAGQDETPSAPTSDMAAVVQELQLIRKQTHDIAKMQFVQARIWRTINQLVGLPAAAVAALAGGLALAGPSNAGLVGVLALIAATLSSFQAVIGAQRRQATAEQCANSYLEVRNAARRLAFLDLPKLTYEQARRRLEELTVRQEEINRTAEPPSSLAIRRGQKHGNEIDEVHKRYITGLA